MASRSPSLIALLGLAAVAGYQNRDKLSEMFREMQTRPDGAREDRRSGGIMDTLRDLGIGPSDNRTGDNSADWGLPGMLSRGINDLVEAFRGAAPEQPTVADSWVSKEPNQPVDERSLEIALGDELLHELTQRTGLNRGEILSRLVAVLPGAVDAMTPEGQIPDLVGNVVLREPRMTGTGGNIW